MSFEKLKEKKKGKREKDGKEEVKVGCHEYHYVLRIVSENHTE